MSFKQIGKDFIRLIIKIVLWAIVAFFVMAALAFLPGITGILSLLISALIAPIEKWQNIVKRVFSKRWIKPVTIAVLFIVMLINVPTPSQTEEQPNVTVHPQNIIEEEEAIPLAKAVEKPDEQPQRATEEKKQVLKESPEKPKAEAKEDIFEGVNGKVKKNLVKTIEDEKLIKDFIQAATQINLDINAVKQFERVEDWTAGPKYTFSYKLNDFIVYCDTESKVISINRGLDQQIYKRGYEPYDINDYVIDAQRVTTLQVACHDIVKTQLNYPKTAKFSVLDWGVSREKDIYYLSSNVTAKNAFGVESEYPFTVAFRVTENSYKPVYFSFYGSVIKSDLDLEDAPERKKIEGFTEEHDFDLNPGDILIINGELGEYGKAIELDGKEYIVYLVPEGVYTVINKGKMSTLFVTSTDYFTNSSGYKENDVYETIYFKETGQEDTITIQDNQQVEVSYHSKYILRPIS